MNKNEILEKYIQPGQVADSAELDKYSMVVKNVPGTLMMGGGGIFSFMLGMPTGFNKIKFRQEQTQIYIFENIEEFNKSDWDFDYLNIPVWYLKDDDGMLFIRVFSPRANMSWIHLINGANIEDVKNTSGISPIDMSKHQHEID